MNNAARMSVGEDLVKICPAVAEQSRQQKKNTQCNVKHKTMPLPAASGNI